MTLREAILFATKAVQAQQKSSALGLSLVSLATAASSAFLLSHPSEHIQKAALQRLQKLTKKAAQGEPLAYLRGYQEFYGLRFIVSRATLIPRPESEQIIDTALALFPRKNPLRIVDVGTGSGCLAITLIHHFPNATAYASDSSRSALRMARKNAKTLKAATHITFASGNLLKTIPDLPIDLLVANLPYLSKQEAVALAPEPSIALAGGGAMGAGVILKLFRQIARRRHCPSIVIVEIDPRIAAAVARAARAGYKKVAVLLDSAHRKRLVLGSQPIASSK